MSKLSNTLYLNSCFLSTSSSKDLFEVLEEKAEEDIGYDQWLLKAKESLNNSKGRFWLGKSFVSIHLFKPIYLFLAISL